MIRKLLNITFDNCEWFDWLFFFFTITKIVMTLQRHCVHLQHLHFRCNTKVRVWVTLRSRHGCHIGAMAPHQHWLINHCVAQFISHRSLCHHHKFGVISGNKNSATEAAQQCFVNTNVEHFSWTTKGCTNVLFLVLIVYQLNRDRAH